MKIKSFQKLFKNYIINDTPFIFLLDFECAKPFICKLKEAEDNELFYDIKGFSNIRKKNINKPIHITKKPPCKAIYKKQFQAVQNELQNGNTYLLNLTCPTPIKINLTMKEIFHASNAPYKLLFKNKFVLFSPECFVNIIDNKIFTYPMKGTIDATLKNAKKLLLENKKEEWEHNTIVDLLRNDLSIIAHNIKVKKYRFIQKIQTNHGAIFQTSSKIKGSLKDNWKQTFAKDLLKLLPAGSISGAPKQKTVEIIHHIETSPRGYYTGVFGIYDGKNLQSAINIRYIEKKGKKFVFKSGGGITSHSILDEEYNELKKKIYVPTL